MDALLEVIHENRFESGRFKSTFKHESDCKEMVQPDGDKSL